jgi:hypothetical protein
MDGIEHAPRHGRYRAFVWMPRGPLGLVLLLILIALAVALVIAVSALLLTAAIVAGIGLAAYQAGRKLLGRDDPRPRRILPVIEGTFVHPGERPLERYLTLVEEFDLLTSSALALPPDAASTGQGARKVSRLMDKVAALREQAVSVERAVAADHTAEAARPGLWELIVAAGELHAYLEALQFFPSAMGGPEQERELSALRDRREDADKRRDGLIRRLQDIDLRATAR